MINTKKLFNDAILVTPISYSYEPERMKDYDNECGWNVPRLDYENMERDDLETVLDYIGAHDFRSQEEDEDDEDYLDAFREHVRERADYDGELELAPMMSFAYPLPHLREDPSELQLKLLKSYTNLMLVEIDDEYYLALTGGGMDFSWEICYAYMIAGYMPPIHFCGHLPRMAGKHRESRTDEVIAGAKRSIEIVKSWAESWERDIKDLENSIQEERKNV